MTEEGCPQCTGHTRVQLFFFFVVVVVVGMRDEADVRAARLTLGRERRPLTADTFIFRVNTSRLNFFFPFVFLFFFVQVARSIRIALVDARPMAPRPLLQWCCSRAAVDFRAIERR